MKDPIIPINPLERERILGREPRIARYPPSPPSVSKGPKLVPGFTHFFTCFRFETEMSSCCPMCRMLPLLCDFRQLNCGRHKRKRHIGRSDRSSARHLELINNDARSQKKPAYLHVVQVQDQSWYIGGSDGECAVRKFYLDVVLALLNCP